MQAHCASPFSFYRRRLKRHAALLLLGVAGITTAWAQASDNPIKIGVLNDQSGVYSAATGAGSVIAAKLAVEDAGSVLGRPVQVLVADHQFKPDVGAGIARRWYDEGVTAIFDIYHSGVGLAVQDIAKSKNKIVMAEINSMLFTNEQCSMRWRRPSAIVSNIRPTSWVVKALVEATPISGPARVISTSSDSRVSELSGTLQIASVAR